MEKLLRVSGVHIASSRSACISSKRSDKLFYSKCRAAEAEKMPFVGIVEPLSALEEGATVHLSFSSSI